jgi:hypothetical protein
MENDHAPVTERALIILMPNGKTSPGRVVFWPDYATRTCHVKLEFGDRVLCENDGSYFDALNRIRGQIESEGIRLLCYGASKFCWPSGMAMEMGAGLHVYRLKIGRKPEMEHLIGTFDTGEDVVPATLAQQKAFADEWLKSIGWKPPANVPRKQPAFLRWFEKKMAEPPGRLTLFLDRVGASVEDRIRRILRK